MTQIMGRSVLKPPQMAGFLVIRNPAPALMPGCTAIQLAEHYISEGEIEGVRGDIAFCQSIQETGWFRFGGDVLPEQNNYCGYAATNTTPKGKGAWFETPQLGVRCQIQHLKAYGSTEPLKQALVQPSNGVPNRFGYITHTKKPRWQKPAGFFRHLYITIPNRPSTKMKRGGFGFDIFWHARRDSNPRPTA